MEILGDVEKPWRIMVKEVPQVATATEESVAIKPSVDDWQNAPAVGWIYPDFFSPS